MRFKKNLKKYFYLILLSIITLVFSGFVVYADTIDILLNNHENTDLVKQELMKIDKSASFEVIPEIGLLRINSTSNDLKAYINQNSKVKLSGELGDLHGETLPVIKDKEVLKKARIPLIQNLKKSSLSDEKELLNSLAWYKDTMLGKDKSILDNFSKNEVKIGLIDSGIDTSHPLLVDNIDLVSAKSFVTEEPYIEDKNGHGTMVAGAIIQLSPNSKLTPYKVLSENGGESFNVLEAIIQAVNDNQEILNMSLGSYKYTNNENEILTVQAYERAVDYARKKGVVLVSSSGNKGLNLDEEFKTSSLRHVPGSVAGVFGISALDINDMITSYSNIGSNIQFSAPGGDIAYVDGYLDLSQMFYTTYPTYFDNMLNELGIPQGYNFSYGTSLAAPCITAIFADFMSYYKNETGNIPSESLIKEYFSKTSLDLGNQGKDIEYGFGLPVLYEAMQNVIAIKSFSINTPSLTVLKIRKKINLDLSIIPENASDKTVSWEIDDNNIASIKNGELEAKTVGITKITGITGNGKKSSFVVRVTQ